MRLLLLLFYKCFVLGRWVEFTLLLVLVSICVTLMILVNLSSSPPVPIVGTCPLIHSTSMVGFVMMVCLCSLEHLVVRRAPYPLLSISAPAYYQVCNYLHACHALEVIHSVPVHPSASPGDTFLLWSNTSYCDAMHVNLYSHTRGLL